MNILLTYRPHTRSVEKIYTLSDREKRLLNVLGNDPAASLQELVSATSYKWTSTVAKKLQQFKTCNILFGPSYYLDIGKLCRNRLAKLFIIIETHKSFETVLSYLSVIRSLGWVFPVLTPRHSMLIAGFYSSDNAQMKSLFYLLKKNGIISDYVIRTSYWRRIMNLPNFYGDPVPSVDSLLEPVSVPPYSYGQFLTEWSECDIAILPYFLTGYKGSKLIEILRTEKEHERHWTYNQISYSYKKMSTDGLITREYALSPFPYYQCVHFILFLKSDNKKTMLNILNNFGKDERVYTEHMPFKGWGLIECISHPRFLINLLNRLDCIEEITEKELYHVRSLLPEKYWLSRTPEFPYNFDTHTVAYPYTLYRETLKEMVENDEKV